MPSQITEHQFAELPPEHAAIVRITFLIGKPGSKKDIFVREYRINNEQTTAEFLDKSFYIANNAELTDIVAWLSTKPQNKGVVHQLAEYIKSLTEFNK